MEVREIKDALQRLAEINRELENEYVENGGEVTVSTEAKEAAIKEVEQLLTGDGIDTLGRWLKTKEDYTKTLKSEKEYIDRQIKANDETIDFIKSLVTEVLSLTKRSEAKGKLGYRFMAYESVKTSADKEILKERYEKVALDAIRKAGAPDCVDVTFGAKVSGIAKGVVLPDFFNTAVKNTVRFTKPRASKD